MVQEQQVVQVKKLVVLPVEVVAFPGQVEWVQLQRHVQQVMAVAVAVLTPLIIDVQVVQAVT
jgi:hypothetical protein